MARARTHRGRFQAQGDGTEKSVPWTLVSPITKSHTNSNIAKLKEKLTPAELAVQQQCFVKAYEFVDRVPANGISAFFKHSCTPFPPYKDVRVDIDVLAGIAFIDD